MRLLSLLLLCLGGLLPDLRAAQRTKVDLVNLTPDIKAGGTSRIAIRFRCDDHFHIYWKNPGDAGQSPAIAWKETAGTKAGPLLYPGPILLDQSGVYNFVHEHETLLVMELAVSVTTAWTPPTSLLSRLWISPVRVSVKKRRGIFCRCA